MEKKFSFSVGSSSSNSSRKKTVPIPSAASNFIDAEFAADRASNDNAKQYVTEFDASKTLSETSRKKLVIPPKENEWRPYKKMKNLELPLDAAGKQNSLDFELEVPEIQSDEKVSYGLNLRESSNGVGGVKLNGADGEKIIMEAVKPRPVENVLLEKLKSDLKRLPEDRGMAEFDDVPVEGFGAALLAGYGWVEGRGIGKNAKEDVKVKEFSKRTAKEGLGFHDDKYVEARKEERKNDRNGEEVEIMASGSRTEQQDTKEEEVVVRGRREQDLVMEEARMFWVGDEVRIIAGRRDVGVKGRVVDIVGRELVLKDAVTGEELKVRVSDVALLGSREEGECVRKLKEMKLRSSEEEDEEERRRVKERREKPCKSSRRKEEKEKGSGHGRKEVGTSQIRWLASNIKVRIISQDVKRGRFYCKKGTVVDVVGPTVCDIYMDDTRELVQGIDQKLLETALPRPGGPVLVLYGRHKGVYGTLLERDRERETGVVRDADTHALLTVDLEQIAEYVGDPADL